MAAFAASKRERSSGDIAGSLVVLDHALDERVGRQSDEFQLGLFRPGIDFASESSIVADNDVNLVELGGGDDVTGP